MLEFSRVVSGALLEAVRPEGPLELLVRRVPERPEADVQLRCTVDRTVSGATLYLGLTAALTVEERRGQFRLAAHPTHQAAAAFDPDWAAWQPLEQLANQVLAIDAYLDRLLSDGTVDPRWFAREGIVQAQLSHKGHPGFGVIQREASVWSTPPTAAVEAAQKISDRMWEATQAARRTDPWWPGVRDRGKRPGMGRSVDLLGIDAAGRVAVIEVKPAPETAKIPWAVAQVGVYGELFASWWHENRDAPTDLRLMAEQRASLGLLDDRWTTTLSETARVVPVLAIGGGSLSPEALPRLAGIAEALALTPSDDPCVGRLDPLEVWLCDEAGAPIDLWRPVDGAPPPKR